MKCTIHCSNKAGLSQPALALETILHQWHYGAGMDSDRARPMVALRLAKLAKAEFDMTMQEFRDGLIDLAAKVPVLVQHISGTLYVGLVEGVHQNFALIPTFRPGEDLTLIRDAEFVHIFGGGQTTDEGGNNGPAA